MAGNGGYFNLVYLQFTFDKYRVRGNEISGIFVLHESRIFIRPPRKKYKEPPVKSWGFFFCMS
jgi:hypothetical protein